MAFKLSTRCRYGVQALFDLAYHAGGGPALVKDIARRQRLPARYLEQIFAALRRARLVEAKRGPTGGYALARPPESITVGDVLRATEGGLALIDPAPAGVNGHDGLAAPTCLWGEVAARVASALETCTVADFCRRGAELGIQREDGADTMYFI